MILSLLSANDRLGQSAIHRTTLVKQAFLAETIRPLYSYWLQTFEFVRYHYGPYSDEIFKQLDPLIFNGLVEVESSERRFGKTEARYRITGDGHRILDRFSDAKIVALTTDLIWALQAVGVEQASTICKLVYQEPEFARIFAEHARENIGPERRVPLSSVTETENQTFATLCTLKELQHDSIQNNRTTSLVPTRELVRVFLLALARQVPH